METSSNSRERINSAPKDTAQCLSGSHVASSGLPKQAGQNISLPQEGQPDTAKDKELTSLSKRAAAPPTFIARVWRCWRLDLLVFYTASFILNVFKHFNPSTEPIPFALGILMMIISLHYLPFSLWRKVDLVLEKGSYPGYVFVFQLITLILLYLRCILHIIDAMSYLGYLSRGSATVDFLSSLDITPLPLIESLYPTFILSLLILTSTMVPLLVYMAVRAIAKQAGKIVRKH